jgi:hypothetical protein
MNWRFGFLKDIVSGYDGCFFLASIHPHEQAPFLQGMTFDECNDGWIHGSGKRRKQLPGKGGTAGDGFWALGFDGNA